MDQIHQIKVKHIIKTVAFLRRFFLCMVIILTCYHIIMDIILQEE